MLGSVFQLQIVKYAFVGALNNLIGYAAYLLLTWHWLDPKVAVSLTYPIGAVVGFYAHGKFSFRYDGGRLASVVRYAVAHCIGYFFNMGLLCILTDLLGYPHQFVQIVSIISVAGILFLLFRYFVFPSKAPYVLTRQVASCRGESL